MPYEKREKQEGNVVFLEEWCEKQEKEKLEPLSQVSDVFLYYCDTYITVQ